MLYLEVGEFFNSLKFKKPKGCRLYKPSKFSNSQQLLILKSFLRYNLEAAENYTHGETNQGTGA